MSYDEIVVLAEQAARWNARRKLLEAFVEPEAAERRVSTNEAGQTQDWLRERQQMFDAIVALEAVGCRVQRPAP